MKQLRLMKLSWKELKQHTNGTIGINIIIAHPKTGMHLARAYTNANNELYYHTNEYMDIGRNLHFDGSEEIYFIGY